jgi:hypothetical protein
MQSFHLRHALLKMASGLGRSGGDLHGFVGLLSAERQQQA